MDKTFTRRAELSAGSYNAKAGTFAAVAATNSPVIQHSFGERVTEILAMTPKAVRLDRFRSGRAPLLDSHRSSSLADQIGLVTNARIQDGQLIVDVRLSDRDDERMRQIRADLKAGILRNVSIGYRVFQSEEGRDATGNEILTHIDWEPVELSLVAIPADSQAHIRSMKGNSMFDEDDNIDAGAGDIENRSADELAGADAVAPSRRRRRLSDREAREIFSLTALANMPGEFAQRHIDHGTSLAEFRGLLFDAQAAEADKTRSISISHDQRGTFDNPDFVGRTIEDVLFSRMTGTAPDGAARELAGCSMLELGARLLQQRGERVSWSNREQLATKILTRAFAAPHTTSDFPVLLTGAGRRVLMDAYQAAESPLKLIAARRDAVDFRAISTLRLSEAPRLLAVGESGAVKHGTRAETKEAFKVETFARIFGLSRNAIINDDLGAFADASRAWGRAAAETEADLLVAMFNANSGAGVNLEDGQPIYAAGHKNKAAAGTMIDVVNLGAARQAMREMKGLDGVTPIGVRPKHLVVGPAKETEAEQVLATIAAATTANANPFAGKLQLHVEPRFTGNAWRLFADAAEIPTIVIAYLNGAAGPILDTQGGWDTLGLEFRAILDFGCGIVDRRGTYLNPGDEN
jgi:HK97 family phage prohead protease